MTEEETEVADIIADAAPLPPLAATYGHSGGATGWTRWRVVPRPKKFVSNGR